MRNEPDSSVKEGKLRAIENARNSQQRAKDSDEAARRADALAKDAATKAQASRDPQDIKESERLTREAQLKKEKSTQYQKDADRAFRSPQEADRLEKLKQTRPEEQKELRKGKNYGRLVFGSMHCMGISNNFSALK